MFFREAIKNTHVVLNFKTKKRLSRDRYGQIKSKRLGGYSLTEILVVIAIIGILILIALPDQTSTIAKAKAIEAKTQLQHVHTLQKMHNYEKSRYSSNLDELGFKQTALVTEGGNANYRIEILSADQNSFVARAVAVTDYDGDGEYNIWEINEKKELIEQQPD